MNLPNAHGRFSSPQDGTGITYRGWADDGDALLVRHLDDLAGLSLGDSFSDDGDGSDLESTRR